MPLQSCVIGLGQGQILQIISLARKVLLVHELDVKATYYYFFIYKMLTVFIKLQSPHIY